MTVAPLYVNWIRRHFSAARFDLASSGITGVSQEEITACERFDAGNSLERLRAIIADHHGVDRDEVFPVMGASQGLWLGYCAMIEPGDEVLIETPSYERLRTAALTAGARVQTFPRREKSYALDPKAVFSAISPRTKVVAITNLHNPSGVRASNDAILDIANALAKTGGYLFIDEVYAHFDQLQNWQEARFASSRHLAANVVVTNSLTKTFGLGRERVGWLLGSHDVISRAEQAVLATCETLPVSWTARAAEAYLWARRVNLNSRENLGERRKRVASWIDARQNLSWSNPAEGLFGFVSTPFEGDLRPAIEAGIKNHDVIVAPGVFFGAPGAFRLAWALPTSQLDEALNRLDAVLRDAGVL